MLWLFLQGMNLTHTGETDTRPYQFVLNNLRDSSFIAYCTKEDYEIRFPYGQKHKNKSISRRVDVLREEVMAWDQGEELAADLGIDIDQKLWHNFIKKNLFDYVRWAYDPETFYNSRQ